jgi:hypothetical protein
MIHPKEYNENDLKIVGEIQSFLDENEVEYGIKDNTFYLTDRSKAKDGRGYEIEYVPSYQYPIAYPKYGIEGVDSDFFYKLSREAEDNNSFRLWIKDFEWMLPRQREVLKSYILHAAHKTPCGWYARECEVRVVGPKEGRPFEDEHCFYGRRGASLSLGLYTKKDKHGVPAGTLIMLYTFGKNFFAKEKGADVTVEVIRVGTRKFSYVAGGSSKLFKYFLNNYKTMQIGKHEVEVKRCKFYVDYCHNVGNSMDNLGFKFLNYSGGGFMNYWLEKGIAKQREPMRHKWIMQQMAEGKVLAIPNSGVKTLIMER